MAADTDHRAYCNHLSHPSSFSSGTQHSNHDVSISELIDHGSISFGRFAVEFLAWEKRSVFSHNRCQEELEKLKGPGIVAQKKAYFEEYYRKIRVLKKLQSEQQEVGQLGLCEEDNIYTTSQMQNSVEITKSKDENKLDNTVQIEVSVDKSNAHPDPPGETTEDKSLVTEKQKENHNNKVIRRDQINITLVAEHESCSEKAASAPDSSVRTCSNSSQPDTLVSITVKLNANKLKDHTPLSKTKGPVSSARDKTKLNSRTRNDTAKPSEKGKQFLDEDTIGKANKSLVLSERATPMPGRNVKYENFSSHRKPTKLQSSTTISHNSVSKHMSAASSSITKDSLPKANSKLGLMSKSTSKHINVTNGVNNVVGKRPSAWIVGKSLESSSRFMTPNRGQSENQKPKIMSMNLPAQTKPNQSLRNKFGLRDYVRSGKQMKTMPPCRRQPIPKESVNAERGQANSIQEFVDLLMEAFHNRNAVGAQPPMTPLANFKDFKIVGPSEFKGNMDPIEAQTWVKGMEKAFIIARVVEEQKTAFSTYMMKGEANFWWEANQTRAGEVVLAWSRFKELFFENYFSRSMQRWKWSF